MRAHRFTSFEVRGGVSFVSVCYVTPARPKPGLSRQIARQPRPRPFRPRAEQAGCQAGPPPARHKKETGMAKSQ